MLQIVSSGIPQWLRAEGGLLNDTGVEKLVNHAKVLFGAFRGKVRRWLLHMRAVLSDGAIRPGLKSVAAVNRHCGSCGIYSGSQL